MVARKTTGTEEVTDTNADPTPKPVVADQPLVEGDPESFAPKNILWQSATVSTNGDGGPSIDDVTHIFAEAREAAIRNHK